MFLSVGSEKKYKHKMVQELRKNGLRKGSWTEAEDKLLRKCIQKYGEGKWHQVPLRAGLNRCRKSCRLRWLNYLRPNIKRGQFAPDEVDLIIRMHKLLGNRWALIAGRLPGRTANDIKNFWNTHVNRKTALEANSGTDTDRQGGDPMERKLVIKPQALVFSKNSSWIKRRAGYNTSSTTNNEPLSPEKEMLTTSCKGLSEFLNGRDEGSTSSFWWESILSDHTQKLEQEIAADINKSSSNCNMAITGSKEDNPNTDLWIHDNLVTANSSMAGDKNAMELVKSSDIDHLFLDDNLWATLSDY